MAHRIPLIDLTFFLLETKDNPTHVAALIVFDLPEGAGRRYVAELAAAYREVPPVAPFKWVPEFPALGMPRWVEAGALDMKYHVRHTALPAGATWSDLHDLVGELHSQVLDRSRPCFRAYFIEGLPDRQFALFVMVHHAMVDGASAIARITASLDESPEARTVRPIHSIDLESATPTARKASDGVLDGLKSIATKQGAAVAGLSRSLLQKRMRRGAPGAGSAPFTAPRTPMNAPMRAQRSIATLSLPLAEMKAVGKSFGGTINDVAVTIIDAALHRYLADLRAEPVDRLVAICPVSLREAGDQEATTKASTMYVPLAQRGATIEKRMEEVMHAVASAKSELLAMNKDAAMLYAVGAFGLADLAVRTGATTVTGPVASLFLSNVPGPRSDRYLNGARMRAIYPISALGIGVGLNVTLISYAGSMDFGFVGNGVKLPGLERLAAHTQEAFAALSRVAARRHPPVVVAGAPTATTTARRKVSAARKTKTSSRRTKASARA